jgi:hypothetical protein
MLDVVLAIIVIGVVFTSVAALAHYAASRIIPWGNQ